MKKIKKHSYIGGITGSFAALCCAGTPIILAFLSGIGLGFLISDYILFPLLFIGLGFMFYSMKGNKQKHVSNRPIILGIIGTILVLVGIWISPLIWLGIISLIGATIWDFILLRKCKTC